MHHLLHFDLGLIIDPIHFSPDRYIFYFRTSTYLNLWTVAVIPHSEDFERLFAAQDGDV